MRTRTRRKGNVIHDVDRRCNTMQHGATIFFRGREMIVVTDGRIRRCDERVKDVMKSCCARTLVARQSLRPAKPLLISAHERGAADQAYHAARRV